MIHSFISPLALPPQVLDQKSPEFLAQARESGWVGGSHRWRGGDPYRREVRLDKEGRSEVWLLQSNVV